MGVQKENQRTEKEMKAFREIGLRKAARFGITTILLVIFRLLPFPQLRSGFLRVVGARVGKNVMVHNVRFFNCYRKGFKGLTIGNDCFIGDDTLIDLADDVRLSEGVTIAERVTIITHTNVGYKDHPLQKHFPPFSKPVTFSKNCFVGACATILPGLNIGECSFVAAGSLVNKNVPASTVVAGVPARVIKTLEG